MTEENTDIYGISGFFLENSLNREMTFFGGIFSTRKTPELLPSLKKVLGQLVDSYGLSGIEGTLAAERLSFTKKYCGRRDDINYNFKFDSEKGIWVGEYWVGGYTGKRPLGKGTAVCKIHQDWPDIVLIRPEYENPEKLAGEMIDKMLRDGRLEEVEDGGQRLLRPKK